MKEIMKKINFKRINLKNIKKFIFNFIYNHKILLFYIISNFINSILLRLFTTGDFKVRPLFFDLGVVLLFAAISLFIRKNGKKAYYIITSILFVAI